MDFTQLRTHVRLFQFKESWYKMMYQCHSDINPGVSLSCCYQFMSCENEMVTWADHHICTLIVHSVIQLWSPLFPGILQGHIWNNADGNKRGACGSSERTRVTQTPWLYSFYSLFSTKPVTDNRLPPGLPQPWVLESYFFFFTYLRQFWKLDQNKALGSSRTQQDTELIDSMATDSSNGRPYPADLFSFAVPV